MAEYFLNLVKDINCRFKKVGKSQTCKSSKKSMPQIKIKLLKTKQKGKL